jgi:hypothetical protein
VILKPPVTPDKPLDLRIVALISLLLSAWLIAIDPVVSRDAIIYLRSTDAYLQQGFVASQELFGRPLLPVCIGLVHQLTGLSTLHAGLLLTSLFFALLCCIFVACVRTLGGGRRAQLFAAAVVLAHPLLAEYRSSIVRDPAYWALVLVALRELLLYLRQSVGGGPTLRHKLTWFLAMGLALLFRFEALFFAVLAPLSLLLIREQPSRLRACLSLLLPQLALLAALVSAELLYQAANQGDRLFPDIGTYLDRLATVLSSLREVTAATGEAMLEFSAREDAGVATAAGLLAVLALNAIRAVTWSWSLTLLWGRWRGLALPLGAADRLLLNAHLLIALLYLALFMLINRFMLERYAGMFALLLLLYLPFVLSRLWAGPLPGRVVVAALLFYLGADTLHNNNYRKAFLQDAAAWFESSTPERATLITNDRYVAYFSRREIEWGRGKPVNYRFNAELLLQSPELVAGYDYLAVRLKPEEYEYWERFLAQQDLRETISFGGGRYGRLAVVALPPK